MNSEERKKLWDEYHIHYPKITHIFQTYEKLLREVMSVAHLLLEFIVHEKQGNPVKIVDLGCGNGNLIKRLCDLSENYPDSPISIMGLDYTKRSLQRAKEQTGDKADFFEANLGVYHFGLDEKGYGKLKNCDLVTINNVFYSLTEVQKQNLLCEVKEILSPKGYFIVSEPQRALNFNEVVSYYLKHYGLLGIFRFIILSIPVLPSLRKVMSINYRYLVDMIDPEDNQQELFTNNGFTLRARFNDAYSGSNTIEVYQHLFVNR